MDLLKPGGYLQWEELNYANVITIPESPTHEKLITLVTIFFTSRDLSITCSHDAQKALKAAGFKNVTVEERNSYWDSTLTPDVRRWAWITLNRSTARALLWSGLARDTDAASIMANDMLNFAHRVVLRRKSICDF